MIGSSMMVNAAEPENQPQMSASEKFTDDEAEQQEEELPDTNATPEVVPDEEQESASAEETEASRETEAPDAEMEPVITPGTTPDEEPDGMPEETQMPDVVPTESPSPEPEMTPSSEPAEIPDESPFPETSATPGMTPFFDEGLMSIAEDEELVGAGTGWVNGWIEGDDTVFTGDETIDASVVNPNNGRVGVKENAVLTLDSCKLVVKNGNFENLGTIIVKGESSVIIDEYYTFTTTGKITLEDGATLTIAGYAVFPQIKDQDSKDIDALSNVSGKGTVVVTGKYGGMANGIQEEGYDIATTTVNAGITLKLKGEFY